KHFTASRGLQTIGSPMTFMDVLRSTRAHGQLPIPPQRGPISFVRGAHYRLRPGRAVLMHDRRNAVLRATVASKEVIVQGSGLYLTKILRRALDIGSDGQKGPNPCRYLTFSLMMFLFTRHAALIRTVSDRSGSTLHS